MNAKLADLARRREMLIARSTAHREQLAQACRQLRGSMRFVEPAVGLIQTLKAHPALVMALTAVLVGARRFHWKKLPVQFLMGWRILRPLGAWWSRRR
ncbi:MAG: hypothetical protein ACREP8_11330 [Candidatus Binatia bacterium]